ncbi:MAG: acyltransferase family protein [Bacteroidetes bacterium]|nr:acyltransferase family protein [Bacteroidota bacterium]
MESEERGAESGERRAGSGEWRAESADPFALRSVPPLFTQVQFKGKSGAVQGETGFSLQDDRLSAGIIAKKIMSRTLQNSPGDRFHGLDAARAIALFIGIFHHGIESFVTYVKSDWITQDNQSNILLDILFYVSHVFRMQAFFLMSGFFAHLLVSRKGIKAFAINRLKRLVLPFILFWPVLYISTFQMWVWGIQYTRHISRDAAIKAVPGYMQWGTGFPLMHLWFLYFLILYCALTAIAYSLFRKRIPDSFVKAIDRFIKRTMNRRYASILLGAFMILPMWGMTDGFGVDTSADELTPRFFPFVIYGMYFFLGWIIYRQTSLLENFTRFKRSNLSFALGLIFLLIILSLLFSDPPPAYARIILAGINTIYAIASMCSVWAFLGYMLSLFSNSNKKVRWLSDSSYWGYLVHLPILGFFQILVTTLHLFWGIKLLLIFVPGISIVFFTYRYAVRNTVMGLLLNGKKQR